MKSSMLYTAAPGSAICLESVKLPGQHVGVLPSGDTKAPGNTGRGPHGSFTVELLQAAAVSYLIILYN